MSFPYVGLPHLCGSETSVFLFVLALVVLLFHGKRIVLGILILILVLILVLTLILVLILFLLHTVFLLYLQIHP